MVKAISDANPRLKTLNGDSSFELYEDPIKFEFLHKTDNKNRFVHAVLAEVDKYAEVEYSIMRSPTISQSYIDLGLKVSPQSPCSFASDLLGNKKEKIHF